jgi:hypothetical protein
MRVASYSKLLGTFLCMCVYACVRVCACVCVVTLCACVGVCVSVCRCAPPKPLTLLELPTPP